jgi:nicotinate-nucleotide adenylyltransferase
MIGVLGGTFDPIHHGHLRLALEMSEQLGLEKVHLIVSANPPHRQMPQTPAEMRFEMVKLAIENEKNLIADDREIKRNRPSYTVETLLEMREEVGKELPICLILGMDAFLGLLTWFKWEKLLELAHLIITQRPEINQTFSEPLQKLLEKHQIYDINKIKEKSAGYILFEAVPMLNISATQIRQCFIKKQNPRYLLPESVLKFISQQGLYNAC